MPQVFHCPQGHEWTEPAQVGEGPPLAAVLNCPICGFPKTDDSPDTIAADHRGLTVAWQETPQATWAYEPPAGLEMPQDWPQITGYEILRELGRGGMGVVYLARQNSLQRIVALKMVLAGVDASPIERARFRAEAEAVAQLQHPNIVQVYEVGEQNGRPYFSLEYVAGGTLASTLGGKPQPPRPTAHFLETLARAVHAAHQRGIIHRDLKPGNILLQTTNGKSPSEKPASQGAAFDLESAIPKITDFGLAKRLDDVSQTRTGEVLGTPSYMAPEQAWGNSKSVGASTDVYALGVIFYEMLTGRPPFCGASSLETLLQVKSVDPVPPTRLQPRVPRDLETICLKSLEKDPRKRYDSAEALADDVRRYLTGVPIRARPSTRSERTLKWARRHPTMAALVGVSALAGFALFVVSLGFNVALRAAADRELARATEAEQQRQRAEANFDRALLAVEAMLTEVAEEQLANEPRMEQKRRVLLEKALKFYEQFLQEKSDEASVRDKTGLAYQHVADILRILGNHERAQDAYERAIQIFEGLVGEFPKRPGYRQQLAESYNWLGESLRRTSRLSDAGQAYQNALVLQQRLTKENPDVPVYAKELARSHYNLGLVATAGARLEEAEQAFRDAIELLKRLMERFPNVPAYTQELARSYLNLGTALRADHQPTKAAETYARATQLLKNLADAHPEVPDYRHELAIVHNNRGNLLGQQRRFGEALQSHRLALSLFQKLANDFPSVPDYQKELANTYNSLGAALALNGDLAGAERSWREASRIYQRLFANFPTVIDYRGSQGMVLGNLGWLSLQRRDPAQSRRHLEHGIRELEEALKPNPANLNHRQALRNQYRDLAEASLALGDHAAAARAADALVRVFSTRAEDSYLAARFLARCAGVAERDPHLTGTGRKQVGDKYADRAVDLLGRALAGGQQNLEALKQEADFGAIRGRSDFAKLLAPKSPAAK